MVPFGFAYVITKCLYQILRLIFLIKQVCVQQLCQSPMHVRGWRKLRNGSCVDALDHFLEKIGYQELITVHMYLEARTSVDPHITLLPCSTLLQ